jgi:hypothetical protein
VEDGECLGTVYIFRGTGKVSGIGTEMVTSEPFSLRVVHLLV